MRLVPHKAKFKDDLYSGGGLEADNSGINFYLKKI